MATPLPTTHVPADPPVEDPRTPPARDAPPDGMSLGEKEWSTARALPRVWERKGNGESDRQRTAAGGVGAVAPDMWARATS